MSSPQGTSVDARSPRQWSVATLGVLFAGSAAGHFASHETGDLLVAAATVLPSVALLAFGVWFALRNPVPGAGTAVLVWAVGGAGLVLALDLWGLTVGAYGVTPRVDHVVIQHTSVGAFGGAVAGTYSERDRRRARSHRRLRHALDAAMDGVAVLDDDGRVVYANETYRQYYGGTDADAVVGEHWRVAYPGDSRDRIADVVASLGGENNHWRGTVVARRANGITYPQDLSMTALDAGYVWVCRDTTGREERDQRLQVLNRVLRHNVRNGMNVVLGHANRIENRHGESEDVASVRDAAEDVLAVSEKARDVERALADSDTVTREDVGEIVADEVERARESYPEATFDVTVDGEAASDRRLRLVVRELLENAVEHSERDDLHVVVSLDVDESVVLRVEDDGTGIPAQEQRALTGEAETPLQHGSGIGLWLVHWLVHQFGGSVDVSEDESITVRLTRERTIQSG